MEEYLARIANALERIADHFDPPIVFSSNTIDDGANDWWKD